MAIDFDDTAETEARDSLLRHYSSECIAHSTHILTFLIVFFAFVQGYDKIPFPNDIIPRYTIIALILSFFAAGLSYSVGRLLVWSYLTSIVISVIPLSEEGIRRRALDLKIPVETIRVNFLTRISWACRDQIKDSRWYVKFFNTRSSFRIIFPSVFLVWLAVFALLIFVYLVMLGQVKIIFNWRRALSPEPLSQSLPLNW
jgi:hypothetical protein